MLDAKKLRGVLTAIVTPMNKDGSIDYGALGALVDWQLEAGVQGLVACGSTGEAATLTADERAKVIGEVVKKTRGRGLVLAGTGSNATAQAIDNQKHAKDAGADAALVVTPYYNKPTPEGLYRHYAAIAEAVDLGIVLYNVPGRTGLDVKPDVVARLARLPAVLGIKEAAGDPDRVTSFRKTCKPEFAILAGDDNLTLPMILLGGHGVICTSSNVVPKEMVALTQAALAGKYDEARTWHEKLRDLFAALFFETNPIPVKAALAMQGRIKEAYRLPLCEMGRNAKDALGAVLKAGGWI